MWSKVRPNVIALALLVAALTGCLAALLIERAEAPVSNEILALLVGVGLGGLVGVMSAVAQDPPPPTIPAGTAEKLALRLMERRSEERKEAE